MFFCDACVCEWRVHTPTPPLRLSRRRLPKLKQVRDAAATPLGLRREGSS